MQPKKKIKYAPAAIYDMDEIFSYIAKDSIQNAEKLLNKIDSRISSLADFPYLGSVLSDDDFNLVSQGYRYIVISPYLAFYRVLDDIIIIHRILHGRRDYIKELFTNFS